MDHQTDDREEPSKETEHVDIPMVSHSSVNSPSWNPPPDDAAFDKIVNTSFSDTSEEFGTEMTGGSPFPAELVPARLKHAPVIFNVRQTMKAPDILLSSIEEGIFRVQPELRRRSSGGTSSLSEQAGSESESKQSQNQAQSKTLAGVQRATDDGEQDGVGVSRTALVRNPFAAEDSPEPGGNDTNGHAIETGPTRFGEHHPAIPGSLDEGTPVTTSEGSTERDLLAANEAPRKLETNKVLDLSAERGDTEISSQNAYSSPTALDANAEETQTLKPGQDTQPANDGRVEKTHSQNGSGNVESDGVQNVQDEATHYSCHASPKSSHNWLNNKILLSICTPPLVVQGEDGNWLSIESNQVDPQCNDKTPPDLQSKFQSMDVDDASGTGQADRLSSPAMDAAVNRPKAVDEVMIDVAPVADEEDEILDVDFEYPCHVVDEPDRLGLSLEKLIILALAARRLTGTPSLTLDGIVEQIRKCSTYYRNQEVDSEATAVPWMQKVEDILHQYDFPTEPVLQADDGELRFRLPEGGEWFILNKPSKGKGKPFMLMELPFELRLMIYTYTLHMPLPPKTGWVPDAEYTLNSKNIYARYDRPPNHLVTIGPAGWQLWSRPVQEILALTMANKAMQVEALPVFYRTNTFYFSSPKLMGRFYAGIPSRREWMRSIILNFAFPSWGHECKRSIALLFRTKLRKFHLIVDEEALMVAFAVADIMNIPGVKFLGELSGIDKVTFQGNSTQLRSFLAAAEITSAKRKEQMKYDTDEEIDNVIERKKKDYSKDIRIAVRRRNRAAKKAATQHERNLHSSEVAKRKRERKRAKKQQEAEKEANRQTSKNKRELKRREREVLEKQIKDSKAARKVESDAERQRKKDAEAKEKASRKATRDAARATKESEKAEKDKKRRREAQKRINEQRAAMKARLSGKEKGGKGGKTKTDVSSAVHDTTDSEDTTQSESESDSEAELSENDYRAQRGRPTAHQARASTKRRKDDTGTAEESTTDDESDAVPASKKRAVAYGGSIRAAADSIKRSSGTGAAARQTRRPLRPTASPAQKMAAMGRSIRNARK